MNLQDFEKIRIDKTGEECYFKLGKPINGIYKAVIIDSANRRFIGYGKNNIEAINNCLSKKCNSDKLNYINDR